MSRRARMPRIVAAGGSGGVEPARFDPDRGLASRSATRLSFALALLVASTVCLGGMIVLDRTLRQPAAGQPAKEAREDPALHDAWERLVGRWVSPAGDVILFSPSGSVWLGSNDMIGAAALKPGDDRRLTVSGSGFACVYAVAFVSDDEADWTLEARSQGTRCPSGRYHRPFF